MEKKNLTCINCPIGCQLEVTLDGEQIVEITGNTCKRGEVYARTELTNPVRVITTTVRVRGDKLEMAAVKTNAAIPKKMIFDAMAAINKVKVEAPVKIGDVIIEDLFGLGVDVVATSNVK